MEIKKYYKLYFSELIKSIKKAIGWREFVYLGVSLVVGATIYFLSSGLNAMNKEIFNFIAFSIAPAILLSILFVIYYLVITHAELYSGIENEAEKYNWNNVTVEEKGYSILGLSGWGINIINKKETTLCVSVWLSQVREGQQVSPKDRVWLLGHVDTEKDMLNVGSYARIKKGENAIFAITTKARQDVLFYIETHGGRINIPDDFVVDVNVEGNFDNPNSLWIPTLFHISIKVNLDGTISIRGLDSKFQEKQQY